MVGRMPSIREKLRLSGKGEPDLLQARLGNRAGDHGCDFAIANESCDFFQSGQCSAGGGFVRLTSIAHAFADNAVVELRGKLPRMQCSINDLRTDAG